MNLESVKRMVLIEREAYELRSCNLLTVLDTDDGCQILPSWEETAWTFR
jgi:hypothetical protein